MTILDTIIAEKENEVAARKQITPASMLERAPLFSRTPLSLKNRLDQESSTGIIAEFKRRSPSKGIINATANVIEVTRAYTQHGAACLSVLTDEKFFGGSTADLEKARTNAIPILRKDFVIDEYQVLEAKAMGADLILLIAANLSPRRVRELASFARSLNLEILLELHAEEELAHVCDEVTLVGINNRNLKTFAVDIERSLEMASKIPAGKPTIAESGIRSVEDVLLFRRNGFRGFLIGENFMKEPDPGQAFAKFAAALAATPARR